MKKILLVFCMISCLVSSVTFASNSGLQTTHKAFGKTSTNRQQMFANISNISYDSFEEILVNGKKLHLDQRPFSIDGNRFLPLKKICENLGCNVSWDGQNYQVKVTRDNNTLLLTIGSNTIIVNGKAKKVKVAPVIVDNRTFVTASIIQLGLGDSVEINPKGDFIITAKNKMNISMDTTNIRKTIYKEDKDGFVTGLAQINIPHFSTKDHNKEKAYAKMNQHFENFANKFSDDELKSALQWSNKELLETIYLDCKIVFVGKDILSIEYPIMNASGLPYGLHTVGEMYYKSTGDKVDINKIFKEKNKGNVVYDVLMNAYINEDRHLAQDLSYLKCITEAKKDVYFSDNTAVLKSLAFCIYDPAETNVPPYVNRFVWLSNKDNALLLNFYFDKSVMSGYTSINLDNALEYLNKSFIDVVFGNTDPIRYLIKDSKGNDTYCFCAMRVGNNLKKYEGNYKLDIIKTFGNKNLKASDENTISNLGLGENEVKVLYNIPDKGNGGLVSSNSLVYLKTSNKFNKEKIGGKEYLVVNSTIKEYWEKID